MSAIVPVEILSRFAPDPDRLLDHLRAQVDDEMLQEIAELDAGELNDGPQFAALKQLRDSGRVPVPMKWEPQEALELATYMEPGRFDDPSEEELRREHVARAFACAAMLRSEVEPGNQFAGRDWGVASLVSSAQYLGAEVEHHAASFLGWRVQRLGETEGRPLFAYALLLLVVLGWNMEASDGEVSVLCDWVLAEQTSERGYFKAHDRTKYWERRLSFSRRSMQRGELRDLSLGLLKYVTGLADAPLRVRLTEIANLVL